MHQIVRNLHLVNSVFSLIRKTNVLFGLDYEEYRLGPSSTNLVLHGATGIIQCTRFDVKKTKIRFNKNLLFSILVLGVLIQYELMYVFFVVNGNTKYYLKLVV